MVHLTHIDVQPISSRQSAAIPAFMRWFAAILLVLSLCTPTIAAPRAQSRIPVYRPLYPPYHTYAAYKSAILQLMEDPAHTDALRMTVSKEKTVGGEFLYLMELGAWNKNGEADSSTPFLPPGTPRIPKEGRPKVLISFGEHAREYVTIESFFHLLEYILQGLKDARENCSIISSNLGEDGEPLSSRDVKEDSLSLIDSAGYRARWSRFIIDHLDLHLLGIVNPDGKIRIEASEQKGKPEYCWRNNGRGVDPNRNGDWEFGGPGSSGKTDSEEYHGQQAWSEVETRFLRDLQRANKYTGYVSVHSGEQQLFVPFVDTKSKSDKRRRPTTQVELAMCQKVVSSPRMNRWLHDSGIGYEMNDYSADGTLMDSMAGSESIPYVFTVELWGGPIHDDCFVQFNPDPKEVRVPARRNGSNNSKTVTRTGLEQDLRQMHVFYIELLNAIIEESYGIKYLDPLERGGEDGMDETQRVLLLKHHESLCQIEKNLYESKKQLAPQTQTTKRVQVQA